MAFRQYAAASGPTIALPTAGLYAQFDANDTASHTPGSGLWTPTSGSDTTDLVFKDSGGTTQTFSYGSDWNGLKTIACPSTREFRPASTSATTTNNMIILMAYRYNASNSWIMSFNQTGSVRCGIQMTSGPYCRLDREGGNIDRLYGSDYDTTARFNIAGVLHYNSKSFSQVYHSGSGYLETKSNLADRVAQLRGTHTAYGSAMAYSASQTGDIDIGEILIYSDNASTADYSVFFEAIAYLHARWAPS